MLTINNRVQKKSGRFYDVNGKQMPSVTTILSSMAKPQLLNWMAKVEREMVLEAASDLYQHTVDMNAPLSREAWDQKMSLAVGQMKAGEKLLKKAGDIGSQVHKMIEQEIERRMGMPTEVQPTTSVEVWAAFTSWMQWADSVKLKPIASEQVVWSKTHSYAGTLDLLAEVNGELAVLDWKTGKAVYPEAHLQNAAYIHAVREMGHGDPMRGYIVRLPKKVGDSAFEVVEAANETNSFEVFLQVKRTWEWMNAQEEKREAAYAALG